MIFCAHTQEWEGLIEKHARLFEANTNLPGEDTYAQLRTHTPVEDMYTR